MIGIGVIGYGYWGPNMARNFSETQGARLAAVSDMRPERLELVQSRYPGTYVTTDAQELINKQQVDAVVISTPVSTHYDLAMRVLEAGKHVLVEKPLAASSKQASRLIEEAWRRNLILMVDHTFIYTGAVRKMKELIDCGDVGDLYYYDSVRVNLGLFQHDVNVIWDLAVHDFSIIEYLIPQKPCGVQATGMAHVAGQPENLSYITLSYENNLIAHVHVNWLAPVKIRRTLVGCSQKMIVWDDLENSDPIKIYDKGVSINHDREQAYQMLYSYRWGDMYSPRVDPTETLKVEAKHFIDCISSGKEPLSNGESGHRVVKLLEAANESLKKRGQFIELT